jgi:nanoRNase/pAp phosphatase (c-di-AMP/oligoRNAs hydrolase)
LGKNIYFEGVSKPAPSCARVVYEYYGGDDKLGKFAEMIHYVDKVDSGNLTSDEILDPRGWVLLGFIMDPRTDLGRFKNFTISNYDLMKDLAKACSEKNINEILALPDVKERLDLYFEQTNSYKQMVLQNAKSVGNVILIDLRNVEPIYAGNRFFIYTLFPDQNISVWVVDGRNKVNVAVTVGYSIVNRTATVDVGALLLYYGGGGHKQVGTCQVPYDDADKVVAEIIEKLKH